MPTDSKTPEEWANTLVDGSHIMDLGRVAGVIREAMAQARREEREACASEAVPAADVIGALPNSSIWSALAYMAERIRARGTGTVEEGQAGEQLDDRRVRGLYGVALYAHSPEAMRWPLGMRVRANGETCTVIGWSMSGLDGSVSGAWLAPGWPAWSTGNMRRLGFDDIEED